MVHGLQQVRRSSKLIHILRSPCALCIAFVVLLTFQVQDAHAQYVQIRFNGTPLTKALTELSSVSGVNIVFSPDIVPRKLVTREYRGDIRAVLNSLLIDSGLGYQVQDGQIILFRDPVYFAPFNISGYVEDAESGERLISAHIYDILTGAGAITNEYGFFSIEGRGRRAQLRISYLGYTSDTLDVKRTAAASALDVSLVPSVVLQEVVIQGSSNRRLSIERLGSHKISDKQLETRPYLGGEQDIQRYMETLPGVSIGTDGIGGMHVRGGNGDQNLVMLDGVPVFHSTHAIGILSIFNPLMIREVNLMKGDFPARYAGRLSSIMDVRTKEGNNQSWSAQGGIGITSANALIEGPIVKDKIGVLVAARKFLPGFYLSDLARKEKERQGVTGDTEYGFGDVNAKCNITLSLKNRLYLSFYHGDDQYYDVTNTEVFEPGSVKTELFTRKLNWGNSVGVLRWNHQLSSKVFVNTTLTLSRFELRSHDYVEYNQVLPSQLTINGFNSREFKSRIKDAGVRLDLEHFMSNSNRLRYGATLTHHIILPKSIGFDDVAQIEDFYIDEGTLDDRLFLKLQVKASELGFYIEDNADISDYVSISGGVHMSGFDIRDTTGKRDAFYWSLQPRLSVRFEVAKNLNTFISANAMTQYMHLLTNSGIGLPTDLWVPSTSSVKPETSQQLSWGINWTPNAAFSLQADIYYRSMNNLVAYKEGASFLFTEGSVQTGILDAANWEDKVTTGTGDASGFEMLSTLKGKWFTTELAYTFANSKRQFDDLNFSRGFPFRFDRRHAVSVSGFMILTDALKVGVTWNYATGVPITLAESRFLHPATSPFFIPIDVLVYSDYNAYRLPAYHRLDVGLQYSWEKPHATHSIHLDVYNAYNRHNVLYVTLVREGDHFKNQQFTVLPIVPSLSYHIKI